MTENKKSIRKIIIILIPFILATLILLPRLISPQFGFFDDANSLSQSQRFLSGDFSMSHDKQAGRFRPIYWLYFATIYALAGYHPFWYFLGNLILLFILLIEIRQLIKRMGGSEWQILLTGILFVLSMPIIENFYTLSKGEPLQLVFLLAAVLAVAPKPGKKPLPFWKTGLIAMLFILLSFLVKETAVVIIPIIFFWLVFIFLSKDTPIRKDRNQYLTLFAASILASVLYISLRLIIKMPFFTSGSYTNRYLVDFGALLQKLLRWITQLAFYFHYMIPFILIVILLICFSRSISKRLRFEVFRWFVWWFFWFVILIPWEFAELYYLLPFAFGGIMLVGIISPAIVERFKHKKGFFDYAVMVLSIFSIILFALTLPNYLTDARTQLTFDSVNQEMLSYLEKNISDDATIFINIQSPNEYTEKPEMFLKDHYLKKDVSYQNINEDLMDSINEHPNAIVLMPFIENQPHLTVRAGLEEAYQSPWNQILLSKTEGHRQTLQTFQDSFRLSKH